MEAILGIKDILNTYKSQYHGTKALENYKNWFPLKPSLELAGIVADLMGDGHLQDSNKWRLDYTSKYKKELERFNREVFSLFKIRGKIRNCTTNKYNTKNLGINNKPLARTLKLIGVPTGAKVLKKFPIPNWILKDKILFAKFINRLFSCEACVDLKTKCIEINMYKSVEILKDGISFFKCIKLYLSKYFEIELTNPFLGGSNKRKDGRVTRAIRIKLRRKDAILKFHKYIGFEDKIKQKKLDTIIKQF